MKPADNTVTARCSKSQQSAASKDKHAARDIAVKVDATCHATMDLQEILPVLGQAEGLACNTSWNASASRMRRAEHR